MLNNKKLNNIMFILLSTLLIAIAVITYLISLQGGN